MECVQPFSSAQEAARAPRSGSEGGAVSVKRAGAAGAHRGLAWGPCGCCRWRASAWCRRRARGAGGRRRARAAGTAPPAAARPARPPGAARTRLFGT